MKKIRIFALLLLAGVLAGAFGQEGGFRLQGGGGALLAIGHGETNPALGEGLGFYHPALFKKCGLGLWLDFTTLTKTEGAVFLFGALAGPVFYVFQKNLGGSALSLPLGGGVFYTGALAGERSIANLGAGVYGALEWHIGDFFYLYGALQPAYAFAEGGEIFLTAKIGAGVKAGKLISKTKK